MVDVVKNNLDRIRQTCREMQVKSLYLIGSGARKTDFNSNSDLDFIFQFKDEENEHVFSKYDYFDLLFKLEEITGKKVDLIAAERIINKYFLKRINEEKLCIYEA